MSKKADGFELKVTTPTECTSGARTVLLVPRALRVQVPDGVYHVTARGNRRQQIFAEPEDHGRFLTLLESTVRRCHWRCHGYCLMPNHYHLIVETPEPNLSAGMQRLNGAYAQAFNDRHGLDGHLFQGRFYSLLVESTWHLLQLIRYLALNPVAGGLCTDPMDWEWGSYAAVAGRFPPRPFVVMDELLRHFGPDLPGAQLALREFVGDAAP
jgi:putative transposase